MKKTKSWTYILVVMGVLLMILLWVATRPATMSTLQLPSSDFGLDTNTRARLAVIAALLIVLVGAIAGIGSNVWPKHRAAVTISGITLMILLGLILGGIALFSAGFVVGF